MNAQVKIEPPDTGIVNAFHTARARAERYHQVILKLLTIIDLEADRREVEGRDELHLREFASNIRKELSA